MYEISQDKLQILYSKIKTKEERKQYKEPKQLQKNVEQICTTTNTVSISWQLL